MLFPPACSSPFITEDLPGSWPGRYMRMDTFGQPQTTQSVRYHIEISDTQQQLLETFFSVIIVLLTASTGLRVERVKGLGGISCPQRPIISIVTTQTYNAKEIDKKTPPPTPPTHYGAEIQVFTAVIVP